MIDASVGSSRTGILSTQLPQGSDEDEFRMSLYVQIIDNDDGSAYFRFKDMLTVEPNMTRANELFDSLTGEGDSTEVMAMLSGTPQEQTQNLLALASALNSLSKTANVSRNGRWNFHKFIIY